MKKVLIYIMPLLIFFSGCSDTDAGKRLLSEDFSSITKKSKGTTVKFFMWGGSTSINNWIDNYVAKELKRVYNIKLVRVPADASVFINKLLGEKQAGKKRGTIDLVWINGENFKNAMENDLLFGPVADKLPNYQKFIDKSTVKYDFGYPVDGFEVPYGRAQFVFEYDTEKVPEPPETFAELQKWAKNNPGKFTYPQPPDFTGSAFIRQAFYAVTGGYHQYINLYDEDLFTKNEKKLWTYLREMRPYLWQNGRTFPKDIAALDDLFERGEVVFNMSYHQADAQSKILQGRYKSSVRTFVMKDGSIYNTHFTAIPYNAGNKPGAMVVANFLLSPEAQLSKNDPKNWGDFTVLDINRLSEQDRNAFQALELGDATLPLNVLASYAVPEIPSDYVEKLEDGWEQNILIR